MKKKSRYALTVEGREVLKRRAAERSIVVQAALRAAMQLPTKTDRKSSNPKDAAATTRLDLSLFPASARAYGALAMSEGDLKYGGFNYREAGVQASVYYAACGRHLDKWFNGEEADPKTKVPHLASSLACLAVLIDAVEQGNLNDDRPPRQSTDVYVRFEGVVAHLQTLFPRQTLRYRQVETTPAA